MRERRIVVSLLHLAVLERQVDSLRNILEYIAKIRDRHGGGRSVEKRIYLRVPDKNSSIHQSLRTQQVCTQSHRMSVNQERFRKPNADG